MPESCPPDELEFQVRVAAEAAVGSAWQYFVRSGENGLEWDDIAGCRSQADYRAKLAAEPGLLLETCQALLEYDTGLTARERADCRAVVAIADALALRAPPPLAPARTAAEPAEVVSVAPQLVEPRPVEPVSAEPGPVAAESATVETARSAGPGRWIGGALLAGATLAALWWVTGGAFHAGAASDAGAPAPTRSATAAADPTVPPVVGQAPVPAGPAAAARGSAPAPSSAPSSATAPTRTDTAPVASRPSAKPAASRQDPAASPAAATQRPVVEIKLPAPVSNAPAPAPAAATPSAAASAPAP